MDQYFISQGLGPPIEVLIDGVPPCLLCGDPVVHGGTDGPLVCASCACGQSADGARWTLEQSEARNAHKLAKIAEYRALEAGRILSAARAFATLDDAAALARARAIVPRLLALCDLRGEALAHYASECGLAKGERSALHDQLTWLRDAVDVACDRMPPSDAVVALRAVVAIDGAVDIECPTCGAMAGWACEGEDYGYHAAGYHATRHVAARRTPFEEARR